ncbi:Uncharacterised protein [Mycobacteroides abscessus subsp. massiliense]|nr:Uncharacterised protein [Mycobacteroides abscessus subsp. massiliense]
MSLMNCTEELEDPSDETPVRCRWCGVRLELIDQLVGAPRWRHRLPKSAPFLRCRVLAVCVRRARALDPRREYDWGSGSPSIAIIPGPIVAGIIGGVKDPHLPRNIQDCVLATAAAAKRRDDSQQVSTAAKTRGSDRRRRIGRVGPDPAMGHQRLGLATALFTSGRAPRRRADECLGLGFPVCPFNGQAVPPWRQIVIAWPQLELALIAHRNPLRAVSLDTLKRPVPRRIRRPIADQKPNRPSRHTIVAKAIVPTQMTTTASPA